MSGNLIFFSPIGALISGVFTVHTITSNDDEHLRYVSFALQNVSIASNFSHGNLKGISLAQDALSELTKEFLRAKM